MLKLLDALGGLQTEEINQSVVTPAHNKPSVLQEYHIVNISICTRDGKTF